MTQKQNRLPPLRSLDEIAAQSGIPRMTLYNRVRRGLTLAQAVDAGRRPRGRGPSIKLADGRPLVASIGSASVKRESVYRRIRRGASPDDAVR